MATIGRNQLSLNQRDRNDGTIGSWRYYNYRSVYVRSQHILYIRSIASDKIENKEMPLSFIHVPLCLYS